jgi:uncharacterized protein YciI
MFIVSLTYTKSLEEVEKHLAAHIVFLDEQYRRNRIVFSGRKNPRTGGVILVYNIDRAGLEKLIEEDPFYKNGVADYEITEVVPTKFAQAFAEFTRIDS